jgi:hypothetical protein
MLEGLLAKASLFESLNLSYKGLMYCFCSKVQDAGC